MSDDQKIEWKQNRMHLSEVLIKLNSSSEEATEFLLEEKIINHLYEKRNEVIEMHLNFNDGNGEEVIEVDFSRLHLVKPVYPLLKQGITLPEIKKENIDEMEKAGTYAIFDKATATWLGKEGWGALRQEFDIVTQEIVKTFLCVTLVPPEVAESGAQWKIEGDIWRDSSASVPMTTGPYKIAFKEIPGWKNPDTEQIQIIEGIDENISVEYTLKEPVTPEERKKNVFLILLAMILFTSGLYFFSSSKSEGTMIADIFPPEAVEKGAKWRIDDGDWQASGTPATLETGDHVVEFMQINGWEGPEKQKLTVKKDQTTKIDAPYAKVMVVKLSPEEAVKAGAGWKISGEETWRASGDRVALKAGIQNEIIFKDVQSWATPAKKIISNQDSALDVSYEKKKPLPLARKEPLHVASKAGSLTVYIHPQEANWLGAKWKIKGPGHWKSSGESLSGLINIPYTVIFRNIDGWKKPDSIKIVSKGKGNVAGEGVYEKLLNTAKTDSLQN